jgi:hypothetical protein
MKKSVQTGLRLNPELNDKIEAKAKEIGVSKNALLTVLIDLGFKVYERPQSE